MVPYLQREDKKHLLKRARKPVLLIVADGATVFDDLEEFFELGVDHDAGCVNNIARVYPCKFQHFFAGDSHDKDMRDICVGLDAEVLSHCYNPNSETFAVRWFKENLGWYGTTTMFAIYTALCLGYYRVVLAGCPMDNSGRWYEHEDLRGMYDHEIHSWRWKQFRWRPWAMFIKSMSGNTAKILGRPTVKWLNEPDKILPKDKATEWLSKPIDTLTSLPMGA
jgi:hypothetical protein